MNNCEMMQMMFPALTNGALNRILDGQDVTNAVIQILGYEKIDCAGKYRYSLLISDGVAASPYAVLGPKLNHLVTNKKLEEFAIVQVKKYDCKEIAKHNVIKLKRLTVVVPGNEVNEKLGNPVIPTVDEEHVMLVLKAHIITWEMKRKDKERKKLEDKKVRLEEENHRMRHGEQLKKTNDLSKKK